MSVQFDNIPVELRQFNQWCLWRFEDKERIKPTKVPYQCNGKMAMVNNFNTWSSFDKVKETYDLGGYDGIGFIFSDDDPYSFVDLDDTSKLSNGDPNPDKNKDSARQKEIFNNLDSYNEFSPSGNGIHVIVKGLLHKSHDNIRHGLKRSNIEIYSERRFATFTGNIYKLKPIQERQEALIKLWVDIGGNTLSNDTIINGEQKEEDDIIINRAYNAINSDKFNRLFTGEWKGYYPSCSEADEALMSMIYFYTKDKEQVERIYKKSQLSYIPKGNYKHRRDRKDYVVRTLNAAIKASQNDDPSLIDFNLNNKSPDTVVITELMNGHDITKSTITYPPGLIGEITDYIYQTAPTPVLEIALASSISFMAGLTGRAYNILDNGLNLYIILIAKSGTGKEWAKAGIEKLIKEIRLNSNGFIPDMDNFIGPRKFASASALMNTLSNQKSFVSIIDEFGLKLQAMLSQDKHITYQNELCGALLEVYGLSGKDSVCRPSVFADKIKNTSIINSPAVSILGLTTPETFYASVNEDSVAQGLLPRFMIIEYNGPSVSFNENRNITPPQKLMKTLENLILNCKTLNANIDNGGSAIPFKFDNISMKISREFSEYCRHKNNNSEKEAFRQLWSRAHMKALKFAGLISLDHMNYYDPMITIQYLNWAIDRVNFDVEALSVKFEKGEVGKENEIRQLREVRRIIMEYKTFSWDKVKSYCDNESLHAAGVVPAKYIHRRLSATSAFKNEKPAPSVAIERSINMLIKYDEIAEADFKINRIKHNTGQKSYKVVNLSQLD